MRVLAHLSDLHFGRVERSALEALRRRVAELAPDLVVVSGDLTQRARARQFRAARVFLESLPGPRLVVPGNHDVPLFNVFARFLAPLRGYRRFIAEDADPSYVDEEIAVLGINTARSLTWKGGAVSEAQLARIREEVGALDGAVIKVLVAHHSCDALEQLGADLVLSGHLHASRAALGERAPAVMVQAGTAASRRTRSEPNAFNVVRISRGRIEVEPQVLLAGAFVPSSAESFRRDASGWSHAASG